MDTNRHFAILTAAILSGGNGQARPRLTEERQRPPRLGRNAPCRCGSGKKFKRCCGG